MLLVQKMVTKKTQKIYIFETKGGGDCLEYSLGHQHVRAEYSRKMALQSFSEFNNYFS